MHERVKREVREATVPMAACVCPDCGSRAVQDRGACRSPAFLASLPPEERRLVDSAAASRLYICQSCGLGFRHPTLSEASLQRMYALMPTERWQYAADNVAWTIAQTWLLRRYAPTDGIRVLDIGAFDGAFLKLLPSEWDRNAIEPSAAARRTLEQSMIRCVAEFLTAPSESQAGSFDVVTMFDVFEHLPSPAESLAQALAYLKPGGHLLISTGNCAHWTWRLLGGDHWYCEPLQHIRFGSPKFVSLQAKRCGAKLLQSRSHSHRKRRLVELAKESFETVAFATLRDRSWWLPLIKLALKCPGITYVRHKTTAPYAPALSDHLFAIFQRPR
jgi:SAM-dependent methyltransferase